MQRNKIYSLLLILTFLITLDSANSQILQTPIINQYSVIPSSSLQDSSFLFCVDADVLDATFDTIAIVTFPDNSVRKYPLKFTPTRDIVQSSCFDNNIGNFEFSFQFLDTQQNGTYQVEFDTSSITGTDRQRTSFDVIEREQKIAKIDSINKVGRITNQPEMKVFGTEYQVGDSGKIFLQLEQGGIPINNATCFFDMFYPNNTIFHSDTPMLYLQNSKGNYYFNQIVPNQTGVYIIGASCEYSFRQFYFNDPNFFPNVDKTFHIVSSFGVLINSVNNMNSLDSLYTEIDSASFGTRTANLTVMYNLTDFIPILTNLTKIEIIYSGQSNSNPLLEISIWNFTGNKFLKLPNTLTYSVQSTAPNGIDEYLTNSIVFSNDFVGNATNQMPEETEANSSNHIIIRYGATKSTSFNVYHNYGIVKLSGISTDIIELKSGSEWHVTSHLIDIKSTLNTIIDYITNTIIPYLLQLVGITTTNQQILNNTASQINQTRIQIANLSQQITNINASQLATKNDIVALNESIRDYLDNIVIGEAYS